MKMWNRNTWCEKVIISSSTILLSAFCLNLIFGDVSFNIWFASYVLALVFTSVWVACYQIRLVLDRNEPFEIASNNIILRNLRNVSFVRDLIVVKPIKTEHDDEPIEFEKASTISSVIERKCIWSWYSQYVSKEIAFPFACKEFLDQIVLKSFQVFAMMHTVNFTSDLLAIILRHLKEYKRSLKRLEKSNKNIEECYRKFHPTSSQRNSNMTSGKGKSTQSYCLSIVKALLKELLPWELWDTPHALLLASILAKRLDVFIDESLSDPVRLRQWILQGTIKARNSPPDVAEQIISETKIDREPANVPNVSPPSIDNEKQNVQINETDIPSTMKTSIESALTNMISNSTAPILQRAEIEENAPRNVLQTIIMNYDKKNGNTTTQPINISNISKSYEFEIGENPKITKNAGDVKIYDRLMDSSVKTWNNDTDLECVSLGQDLLASLDREMGFESRIGRLWEADSAESNELWNINPSSSNSSIKSPHRLWFGEEDNQDMELTEESPPKITVQTNTTTNYSNFSITKPLGIQNMKELQNISKHTVNQAKNKIGDLQDEAAGVMEGILDFGIAGIKKGLRLTGLQESLQDSSKEKVSTVTTTSTTTTTKTSSENTASNLVAAIGQVLSSSRKNSQTDESDIQKIDTTPSKKEEIGHDKSNQPQPSHLVKQHRVISQDGDAANIKVENITSNQVIDGPPLAIDSVMIASDSPDYEYEEVEDFASTIAKLRCLLQQKTGDITPVFGEDSNNKQPKKPNTTPLMHSNNSPVNQANQVTYRLEEIPSVSSVESENGFTILSQNIDDLVEAEDALNQKSFQTGLPLQENNIQRLDKLFTRTVTGVFNSIKTAVGGDAVTEILPGHTDIVSGTLDKQRVLPPIVKDSWVFTRKDVDASTLIGKLLVERRGYCIVEAAQDSLETLGGTQNYTTISKEGEMLTSIIQDDLDEAEIIDKCPLWHMTIEIIAVIMGGVMQKDVFIKCATIAASETVENILQNNLRFASGCLKTKVIDLFQDIHKNLETTTSSVDSEKYSDIKIDKLCDEIFELFPKIIFTIFGRDELEEAIQTILSSIDHQLINRDLIFNMLDVFVLHFLKANALRNNACTSTPPPSA